MGRQEILEEMVTIYQKYFKVVEQLGTITMSPQDKERLDFLVIAWQATETTS